MDENISNSTPITITGYNALSKRIDELDKRIAKIERQFELLLRSLKR